MLPAMCLRSTAALLDLLRPPTAFRLMLIASYRANDAQSSVLLQELRTRLPESTRVREVEVGPLAIEDAERLAFDLLPDDRRSRSAAQAVARESAHVRLLRWYRFLIFRRSEP
jgi:hypothetical protein